MDTQRNSLLSWAYYCQGKSMDDLKHSLLCTTLELESTRLAAQEELRRREDQLTHLKDLLTRAIRERDEAHDKCQKLLYEKIILQQQHHHNQHQQNAPLSGISSIEDEPRRGIDSNNGFSSSDCEESIVSSPVMDPIAPLKLAAVAAAPPPPHPPHSVPDSALELVPEKPLPEKGKLLQAVMKAGPLLQTLLLAGPLPQWRHPPPPIDTFEIPPVAIPSPPPPPQLLHHDPLININASNIATSCGRVNRKRAFCEGSDSSPETKFPRVVLH
ncbi:uncharacterized protein LOC131149315 [Malania oleifera]|uniref:uncharacterized protein LOC131149315 n=1 Tax=Malania oleifera TaxID=397392 RepID=UPI0025AE2AE6|nr:uncharacterized protein LOC131149315 [Malania oleifera]